MNRHELYHAAALFRIAVLGFCIMGAIKKEKQEFLQLENVVTSSTNPGFGGWFDDPVIRMIQVERLKLQPCPTLFSESLAPSVSHLGDENNNLCQLFASDPSLCSIFDAERLLRQVHQQMQQMKLEWNSIEALCSTLKRCNHGNHGPAISEFQTIDFKIRFLFVLFDPIGCIAFVSHGLNAQRRLFSGRLFPHYQVDLTSHQFKMHLNH